MSKKEGLRLLLTGGGTGGHLFPAVATAQEFRRRDSRTQVLFVGTRRRVDEKSLAAYGFERESITCYGFKGKNIVQLVKALVSLPIGYSQALNILRRFQPDVVLGVGGYVTAPVVVAARRLGIAVVLHEQNTVPGLANRKLASLANRICLSLPESGVYFPSEKSILTGNPVRSEIKELASQTEQPHAKKTILVLGGSQGAIGVNRLVCEMLRRGGQGLSQYQIIHQTGERDEAEVRTFYRTQETEAEVAAFFTDMPKIYARADLVISRAGATTLAELAVLGKPALLIPYPFAADNHQEKNAEHYVVAGGARMFPEKSTDPDELAAAVAELMEDDTKRHIMARAMKDAAMPDAAASIADCCFDAIKKGVTDA